MAEDPTPKTIRAAGGLLWRPSGDGYEIAIVHRARYNDWTLPKGKLANGETWQEAALREVLEETGWKAELAGFAGAIAYSTDEGPKLVLFWHMLCVNRGETLIDEEVAEVIWAPIHQARQKVQYPLEQALLQIWSGPGELT